jgi:hypothetical protein
LRIRTGSRTLLGKLRPRDRRPEHWERWRDSRPIAPRLIITQAGAHASRTVTAVIRQHKLPQPVAPINFLPGLRRFHQRHPFGRIAFVWLLRVHKHV